MLDKPVHYSFSFTLVQLVNTYCWAFPKYTLLANDSLFVHAFGAEIEQTLKTGTSKQKKIMERYLMFVKKNKTATAK